jgi:tripartite-type tricarboxylate transporter receptor subunit TctC
MRRSFLGKSLAFLFGAAAAFGFALPAYSQADDDFYAGKTITLILSSAAGGGYDAMSRILSQHLTRHIPGHPTIVIQNMPGAGGISATNYLFAIAPKDGTVIGGVQNNTPFEPLFGTAQARYDPNEFQWLGTPSVETGLVAVWHTVPVDSIEDVRTREIVVGSTGANSTPTFYAKLINETLHTQMRIIVGYPGQADSFNAMERGEVDGVPSIFYSSLIATKPDWLRNGDVKLLLQYGPEREADLPDVPFVMDLVSDEDDRLLLQVGFAALELGRPFLMPPGVPEGRVALMRRAFMETFNDEAFRRDANRIGLDATDPRSGEQMQALIAEAYGAPDRVIQRLRTLTSAN